MGQTIDKWRDTTEIQKQRNMLLSVLNRKEKIEFIKWAKTFDFDQDQQLPNNKIHKIMALGYISDRDIAKQMNEKGQKIDMSPIPFGITKEEWDDPDSVLLETDPEDSED